MIKEILELQALAQSGLAYCEVPFDIERYQRITEITASLLAKISYEKYEHILELFHHERGYATPKVDVRGAIVKGSKILLVREKVDGLWTLPGGFADINLSPADNVVKEIREEAGFESVAKKLIGVFDKQKHHPDVKWPHIYKLLFLCELTSDIQVPFDRKEILDVAFFDRTEIPELSKERTNLLHLNLCFKHFENSNLTTYFE